MISNPLRQSLIMPEAFSDAGTRGSLNSFLIKPIAFSPALTGIGLLSMKQFL